MSSMLPVSLTLARRYIVTVDPVLMCHHNYQVALDSGYHQVAQVWQVVGQVLLAAKEIGEGGDRGPWSVCPLGQPLITSLLQHHIRCRDFQTVAMIICALTQQTKHKRKVVPVDCAVEPSNQEKDKFWFLKSSGLLGSGQGDSPYHTCLLYTSPSPRDS